MKILDKITLILFSLIILVISIITVLLIFGLISFSTIAALFANLIANSMATNIAIGLLIVCILLSVKAIFFGSNVKTNTGMNGERNLT